MTPRISRGRLLPALFDLMVAGLVVVGGAAGAGAEGGLVETLLIGGTMTIAVLFRRRHPVLVMTVVSVLAFVQVLVAPTAPAGYDVAVLVALYAIVKYAREVFYAYLGAVVVGLGIVLALVKGGRVDSLPTEVVAYVAVCAAVWLVAYVVRTRRIYVESLEERAATLERERDHLAKLAAADERAAIARELHDVVAHSLAVMIVQADGAAYTVDADRGQARTAMRTIAATGRDALEDMRRIVGVLRGAAGPADGQERKRIGLDQLGALAERARSAGLGVDLRVQGQPRALAPAEELTVYRLAQEGLTNALRHAGPGALVTVALTFQPTAVALEIVDDGAGRLVTVGGISEAVTRPLAAGTGGHGLIGMRERVAVHGGQFDAGPRLGGGWQVRALLPVKGAA